MEGSFKMSIAKTLFGQTPDGQPIYLYTLTNSHGISASFTDLGGTWVSMMVPDRDGQMADVVLGYDTVEKYMVDVYKRQVLPSRPRSR